MVVAATASPAAAQVPGEYPHLVLSDAVHPDTPGPGGPWDNSHAFEVFSGQSFEAHISYQAVGQLNTNVFWGLLVSAAPTPYPTSIVPPPLLTMPPFVLIVPPIPSLDVDGEGHLKLFVPAGLFPIDAWLQGLVYDSTNAPPLQLSNGLRLDIEAPDLSVRYAFLRSQPGGPEGQLGDAGLIDIDASRLKTLKPLGPNPPPPPAEGAPIPGTTVEVENPLGVPYAFLPIVANAPDAPVNPLARPMTTIAGAVNGTTGTITVEDTSFFPSRGRLLIALGSSNLWTQRDAEDIGNAEVVVYRGKTRTSFLNCQRMQIGTQADSTDMKHVNGETVVGEFTQATTAGARQRARLGLDSDNPDLPHVVLPDISVTPPGGGPAQTRSLDLYCFEREDGSQGFMTFDRIAGQWRQIPGTLQGPASGRWDPMICVAPDNKSFVAVLRVSGGVLGWDNNPDQIWAVRLDGGTWPGSGGEAWQITYQLTLDPGFLIDTVASRRAVPRCFAIVGPNADNYVLYAGLAHKWKSSQPTPGSGTSTNGGFEAEYIREEVLVRDLIECPLVPPGSSKTPPSMPRPYIVSQFPQTGTGFPVVRFDPEMLVSPDRTRLLVVAGRSEFEEDAYVIRNVTVTAAGTVSKTLVNASGATSPAREIRAMNLGGHGQGGKAAFSPNGSRIAYLVRAGLVSSTPRRDWIDIAQSSGGSYGQVKHVYADSSGLEFKEPGAYKDERVVAGLQFLDENRIVFLMGRNPYDNPLGTTPADAVGMDWFAYNLTTGLMTNLSRSYDVVPPPATTFSNLGTLKPGGFFRAPGGQYSYLLRFGGLSTTGGASLPAGTAVSNVLGLNHQTLGVFAATGDEFGPTGVDNLVVPDSECRAPVESAAAMRFAEGFGVQEGMLYFTAHVAGGNGSDQVVALNRDAPFVALQATATGLSGVHVRNVAVDPWSGKVAFSRSGTSALGAANEHPFVVDLDAFLFERDLLPAWFVGGNPIGRVMDGSFQFIGPSGGADEALVFSFGLDVMPQGGAAQTAPPAYYSLSAVSNPLAEPIPVLIPLIDTALLGGDFRFYVLTAGPSTGD